MRQTFNNQLQPHRCTRFKSKIATRDKSDWDLRCHLIRRAQYYTCGVCGELYTAGSGGGYSISGTLCNNNLFTDLLVASREHVRILIGATPTQGAAPFQQIVTSSSYYSLENNTTLLGGDSHKWGKFLYEYYISKYENLIYIWRIGIQNKIIYSDVCGLPYSIFLICLMRPTESWVAVLFFFLFLGRHPTNDYCVLWHEASHSQTEACVLSELPLLAEYFFHPSKYEWPW